MFKRIIYNKFFLFTIMFLVIHMVVSPGYYTAHAVEKTKEELKNNYFFTYNKQNDTVPQKKSKSSSELLKEKIAQVYRVIESETVEKDTYVSNTIDKSSLDLKQLTEEIKELDKEIRKEFGQTENLLKRKNLSNELLERHHQFVKNYEENFYILLSTLEVINNKSSNDKFTMSFINNDSNIADQKEILIETIKNNWLKNEYNPFEKNEFPEKMVDLQAGEPSEYQSIIPAYEYKSNNQMDNITYQSTPSDLQETIEINFTPEIKELARDLDYNPLKIYEYVKNNFDYEPYYGSVKGVQETLWQKAGNDFDQASLLISLYRESGIPARYVYGVVRVPFEKAKNWIGVDDDNTALNAFSSGGIPTKGLQFGGKIEYVELEHVWVEAYVPLTYYRGSAADDSGKGWIPLDSSFKKYEEIEGANLEEELPFDTEGFINELENRAVIGDNGASVSNIDQEYIQTQLEEYQGLLKTHLEENYSESRVEDILGARKIVQEEYSILPLSLPYKVATVHQELSSLNDSFRQKLKLSIADKYEFSSIEYQASIPELTGKRISLSYVAASEADAELITSYLPEVSEDGTEIDPEDLPDSLPAYLIKVKPQIMIDGKIKATGSPVTMGEMQNFYMNFTYPEYALNTSDEIHNEITAGGQYVINLDTGRISQDQLNKKLAALKTTKSNLENEEFDKIEPSSISGDLLHSIGLSYFAQLDMFNQLLESKNGVKSTRITSAGITAIDLNVGYLFGMPKTVSAGGLSIDVDRDLHTIQALDGDSEKVKAYNMVTGQISSYLEGGVFQQIFGGEAVSAMHILQHANMQGIKTYQINQDNADSIIPQLQYDSAKKQMFRDLINSGKEITVPEKNVTIGGWTGTGYTALNPEDGTGAYMIDGGLNGGEYLFTDTDTAIAWGLTWTGVLFKIADRLSWVFGAYVIGTSIYNDITNFLDGNITLEQVMALSVIHLANIWMLATLILASLAGAGSIALVILIIWFMALSIFFNYVREEILNGETSWKTKNKYRQIAYT